MLRQSARLLAATGAPACTALVDAPAAFCTHSRPWLANAAARLLSSSPCSSCPSAETAHQASARAGPGTGTGGPLVPAWVFLGPPGVGKGTYASRVAEWLSIPHVAAGDLVREEMKSGSALGREMAQIVNTGNLLSDEVVIRLLAKRLDRAQQEGELGVLLDGFPRTVGQARELIGLADVQLALNLQLREDVLVAKCLGRRACAKCGRGYNVADINVPADPQRGLPSIVMPPLNPPLECTAGGRCVLETRADDTGPVVLHRLQVYNEQAAPLEEFFRAQGLLRDFQIGGGIFDTMPLLQRLLEPFAERLLGGLPPQAQAA